MIDYAGFSDKQELCNLWQNIFLEDTEVTEYFFKYIFGDTVAPVIRIDGKIVSALFLLDCNIGNYKGKFVYCAMTDHACRGKGYMKTLLDFSYNLVIESGFDFLVLIPAEKSLFEYYKKCGFEKFGVRRTYTSNGNMPESNGSLFYEQELLFCKEISDYWSFSCIRYGGEVNEFGLFFQDGEGVLRNANGSFEDLPAKYKNYGIIIQGNINFGENEAPAMIKTDNDILKNICCYIGITLE